MNPALQSNELSDGIMAKTELSANVGLPFTGSNSGTDFSDKISGQSFPVSTIFKRMLSVPFRSAPFKIGKGIVGADEISVVDLREIVGIGDKSKTHQAMNHKTLSLSRFISKSNAAISIFIRFWRHNFRWLADRLYGSAPDMGNCAAKAPDPAKARYFIQVLKSRNGTPFFVDHFDSPKANDGIDGTRSWGMGQTEEIVACQLP